MVLGRWLKIMFGVTLTVVGAGGVPLAVTSGDLTKTVIYTIMLFGGIGFLGHLAKE